jgi:hypothetical protein
MKSRLTTATAAAFLACWLTPASRATEFRPAGGEGGDEYRAACPQGSYLIGVEGAFGEWVDRLQIVCATVANGDVGRPQVMPQLIGDSQGGRHDNAICANGSVVNGILASFTKKRANYTGFLDNLELHCADSATGAPGQGAAYSPTLGQGMYATLPPPQTCPTGEFATGIHGRAGLFIDSVGLICGPAPAGAAPGIAIGRAIGPAQRALMRAARGSVSTGATTGPAVSEATRVPIPAQPQSQTQMGTPSAVSSIPAPPPPTDSHGQPLNPPAQPPPSPVNHRGQPLNPGIVPRPAPVNNRGQTPEQAAQEEQQAHAEQPPAAPPAPEQGARFPRRQPTEERKP